MSRLFSASVAVLGLLSLLFWLAGPVAAGAQTQPVLYNQLFVMTNTSLGSQPVSICLVSNSFLYGVDYGNSAVFNFNDGQYTVDFVDLSSFTGNTNVAVDSVSGDLYGQVPLFGGLTMIAGNDSNLYGTVYGAEGNSGSAYMKPEGGILSILHSFSAAEGNPVNLIQAADGALYGTTWKGNFFRLTTDGTQFTFYIASIGGYCPSLIQGSDGRLYGTVLFATSGSDTNTGNIFSMNTNGADLTILTNLVMAGFDSSSTILQGSDGHLYLTPGFGGFKNAINGICRMNTDGTGLTLLRRFVDSLSNPDGSLPTGLVEGQDGLLYGTTVEGGTSNDGTLYQIGPNGSDYQVLYNFTDTNAFPMGALAAGSLPGVGDVIYGTTTTADVKNAFGGIFSLAVNPALSITPSVSNQQMTVSWPVWANGYYVQQATNLLSPAWVSDGQGKLIEEKGSLGFVQLLVTNTSPAVYYRLAFPGP